MDSNFPEKKQKMTLDLLAYRKQTVLADIRKQKEVINAKTQQLVSPFKPTTEKTSLMKSMDMGMAVFNGVMFSIKMFKKVKNSFRGW